MAVSALSQASPSWQARRVRGARSEGTAVISCRCRMNPPLPEWEPPRPHGWREWVIAFLESDIPIWIGYLVSMAICGGAVGWTLYYLTR